MALGSEMVPIDAPGYSPAADIQRLLPDAASLERLNTYLHYTNAYKVELDNEILENQRQYEEYLQGEESFDPQSARHDLGEIIKRINENKQLSLNTQNVIGTMTSSIKRLDEAKKNLVLTMTVLKRLQMLTHAYEQLEVLAVEKRYTEVVALLGAVAELIEHFKTYKSIDQVAELSRNVHGLKIQLADQIFKDFELTFNNQDPISDVELNSACKILDLLGPEYHDRLVNWFCNQQLKEIKSIFASTDEAGSLENLNRRFIFFKKVLKTYEGNFVPYFPLDWKVEEELTLKFTQHTKDTISQVLSLTGKSTNVDTLLGSLQQTLDFEKYLNNHFHYINQQQQEQPSEAYTGLEDKFTRSVSTAFEPFLGLWVENQNTFLNNKFLEFLSQPKLPEDHHDGSTNVIPSSADLFRSYRHLFTQCSNLSTGSPLKDLSQLFSNWTIEYCNKILKPTLPPSITDNEGILYVTLVLNTADYFSTTISQLEEKIIEIIEEPYKKSVNFGKAKESCVKLINKSINLLVGKIGQESDFAWREMANANWAHVEEVGDQSRYVSTLKEILTSNCSEILPKISRDIYTRSFCDKVVELITNQFLSNLVKIKPIPVIVAEQMLLDLSVLKSIFVKLPELASPTEPHKVSSQFLKHVDRLVNRLETILKLLLTQDAPQEGIVSNYFFLIGDKSIDNFIKILQLKGVTNANRQSKLIDLFKIHMKAHEDLTDNSPILSKLVMDPNQSQTPSSPSTGGGISFPSIRSPVGVDGSNSPRFENILKKDNFEKGLKELAINGEAGVSKFNENFQKFGRFFNRSHDNNYNNNNNDHGNKNGTQDDS